MHKAQRLINHVALVLDGSSSMRSHTDNLIKVADEQIQHLALRSEELAQETRVSVYLFNNYVECLIFDMDVMRLPSIADLYSATGMTALIDAVLKSQEDLNTTSQLYGDHAFLTFVLTDGEENKSRHSSSTLSRVLSGAQENWTVGWLVPNSSGRSYVKRIGAYDGSIAIWDTTSAKGLTEAVGRIQTATDSFMAARATGVRGTRNVFSTGLDAVNTQTVATTLTPLANKKFSLYPVHDKGRIDEFVRNMKGQYVKGKAFYQLTKRETIQPQKELIVVDKATGEAYGGPQARSLVGLGNLHERVSPDANPLYDIFVQSTSLNRLLVPKTQVLVLA